MNSRREAGFTMVELVIVIVLIGILSYSAIPLFASKSIYASRLAADQLVSQLQLAQRVALGMSAIANPVSLRINANADTWDFTVLKTGHAPYTVTAESTNVSLQVNGTTLSSGGSVTYTWNSSANLMPFANYEFQFVGESTNRVCLSASGYAYKRIGACL